MGKSDLFLLIACVVYLVFIAYGLFLKGMTFHIWMGASFLYWICAGSLWLSVGIIFDEID